VYAVAIIARLRRISSSVRAAVDPLSGSFIACRSGIVGVAGMEGVEMHIAPAYACEGLG
jgi:hypothetical protein